MSVAVIRSLSWGLANRPFFSFSHVSNGSKAVSYTVCCQGRRVRTDQQQQQQEVPAPPMADVTAQIIPPAADAAAKAADGLAEDLSKK